MKTQIKAIGQHGLNNLQKISPNEVHGCDLHHELYNIDYFNGKIDEKAFLKKYGVFEAIEKVTTYEKDNFGEITTNISQTYKLLNMLAYIIGEELLQECETLRAAWDNRLTFDDLKAINKELKQAIKEYKG